MCGWSSLESVLNKINKTKYLILRNYETLTKNIDYGDDIDILCSDKEDLIRQIHAVPITSGDKIFNYYIMIENKKIFIDIREIGDGYYDEKWERNMLKNRVKFRNFYILDNENYKYSLLYHVIIHKYNIPIKYSKILTEMFKTEIGDDERTDILLCDYMHKKGYSLLRPTDKGVVFNSQNYDRLTRLMEEEWVKK